MMKTEDLNIIDRQAAVPRPSRIRPFLRLSKYVIALGITVIFLGNVLWQMSGSSRWDLELERNGVKVYSLKTPGAYNKQYKAVMRGDFTLNQLVAGLIQNSTSEMCEKHIPNCMRVQVISPWSDSTMTDTVLWKLKLPAPFLPRETVIRSHVVQDLQTNVVTVDVYAAPNSTSRNPGTIRLVHFQNRWMYTPVENGQVEIEFLQDIDMGGLFPDILLNLAGAEETYKFIHDQLPKLLDRNELRNAKYDFIMEGKR